MSVDPKHLDYLRATVSVSEVASALGITLKRAGSEYKALSPFGPEKSPSFTVNDKKGIFSDFSSAGGDRSGDVFQLVMEVRGVSFPEAVAEVERIGGVGGRPTQGNGRSVGGREQRAARRSESEKSNDGELAVGEATAHGRQVDNSGAKPRRKFGRIVATYDYHDREGNLAYQVVRFDPKAFAQRRKPRLDDPQEDIKADGWVWNLKGVEHTLYRLPELLADLSLPREEQSPWFLCEGEKDVHTLLDWGFCATTNSGGAKHWNDEFAKHFSDAADVIIMQDGDDAGADRTAKLVPLLQDVGAHVRVLRIRDRDDRAKDITDWRDLGGTSDQLGQIIDKLKEWEAPPYRSRFGVKTFADLNAAPSPYRWRIKGLVPAVDNMLVIGPSRSGKTFAVLDMALHVALGRERYAGHIVMPGGIAYCSYEGQAGFENRLRAYIKHHGLKADDLASFAWWTNPPGLFGNPEAAAELARDIKTISAKWPRPLAAVVIDTHNSATRGASEIKSEEISKILDCYDIITKETGAPLWIISHTNNERRHRGNQLIFNRIETMIFIERVLEGRGNDVVEKRDDLNRILRRFSVEKQREGDDTQRWEFVLEVVDLGKDADGDPVTSMVTDEPIRAGYADDAVSRKRTGPGGAWQLSKSEADFFRAMLKAIEARGVAPPPELMADGKPLILPPHVRMVAWRDITTIYRQLIPPDDDSDEARKKLHNKIKTYMHRAREHLKRREVICIAAVGADEKSSAHYLWPSGRPVIGPGVSWPQRADVRNDTADDDEIPATSTRGRF